MNTRNQTKMIVALLAVMLIASSLFAAGMKESDPQAVTLRIITATEQNGQMFFGARTLEGEDIAFQTNTYTDSSYPVTSLQRGDYLEVVMLNGVATQIRYINPLVAVGALPYSISMEQATKLESLTDRFSYTYGYLLIQSFAQQGLYFDAGYYTKGSLDGYADSMSEMQRGFYTIDELYENVNRYQEEIWDLGLAEAGYGMPYETIADVADLEKPEDIALAFSYTYGYLLALNMASQGLEVNGDLYASGALDYASGNPLQMNEMEMQVAFAEYQQVLEAEYADWMTEVAAANLVDAEAFLEQNMLNEDVIVTASGLQYQVLLPAEGAKPVMEDEVEVNYQLQLMDGSVVDSSYDRGETAIFPVNGLIEGFTEALLTMNTGSVIRTWVHPSLGYGEQGTDTILPNSLLIFDIELVGIN